jgi:hypothetical protein
VHFPLTGIRDMPKEKNMNTKFLQENWRDGLTKKLRNSAQSVGFAKYCNAIVSEEK